jgi:hypothetical protein
VTHRPTCCNTGVCSSCVRGYMVSTRKFLTCMSCKQPQEADVCRVALKDHCVCCGEALGRYDVDGVGAVRCFRVTGAELRASDE